MSHHALLTALSDGVLTLTLNRPDVRNALDPELQTQLTITLEEAARDTSVRVVVLAGAGGSFCSGGDLNSLGAADLHDPVARRCVAGPTWDAPESRADRLRRSAEAAVLLFTMGKPTIAMLRGCAIGAGMSLALACDFRIAAEGAYMMSGFIKIGASGDYGGSYFLTKLVGPAKAKELYMLGDRIGSKQALELGLVSRVFSEESLVHETYEFAARLAKGPPVAFRMIKDNVLAALDESLQRALLIETRNHIRCRFTEDSAEALKALRESRDAYFRGL
jgi:2-(1,2-epoxy-1,2-dihydrophenyl)acetyl-CoA isomerase